GSCVGAACRPWDSGPSAPWASSVAGTPGASADGAAPEGVMAPYRPAGACSGADCEAGRSEASARGPVEAARVAGSSPAGTGSSAGACASGAGSADGWSSATQKFHPSGAGPQEGSGCQPGGGLQFESSIGQFGGGLKR